MTSKIENEEIVLKESVDEDYNMVEEATEGVIKGFGSSKMQSTKFGERKVLPVFVEVKGQDKPVRINIFLNPEKQTLHVKSNAYKLLRRAGAKSLNGLVGKKVPLRMSQTGFYAFDV